jgi:hypothetical protein
MICRAAVPAAACAPLASTTVTTQSFQSGNRIANTQLARPTVGSSVAHSEQAERKGRHSAAQRSQTQHGRSAITNTHCTSATRARSPPAHRAHQRTTSGTRLPESSMDHTRAASRSWKRATHTCHQPGDPLWACLRLDLGRLGEASNTRDRRGADGRRVWPP